MFDPNTHKVFASKDVLFHENAGEVPKEDQGEASSIIDRTSSQSMPRRDGGIP